jgi:hypothetical protein
LALELAGRAAVGHLRLNEIIQGQEIVLEGVESDEASHIAGAVERAVDAANSDRANGSAVNPIKNVAQTEADAVARRTA